LGVLSTYISELYDEAKPLPSLKRRKGAIQSYFFLFLFSGHSKLLISFSSSFFFNGCFCFHMGAKKPFKNEKVHWQAIGKKRVVQK